MRNGPRTSIVLPARSIGTFAQMPDGKSFVSGCCPAHSGERAGSSGSGLVRAMREMQGPTWMVAKLDRGRSAVALANANTWSMNRYFLTKETELVSDARYRFPFSTESTSSISLHVGVPG